jgi:hypothetical protein
MMTREEVIDLVIKVFDTLEGECNIEYDWSKEHNARDMAIKALERDSILDKIRAEIQSLRNCSCSCSDGIIDDVEDILDKYKAGE